MNKIISVVIPTYNMEKYLENCLNSFIYDKSTNDLEVLIVNDGSKDNSLKIAKEYEEKYPNIFKVIDKENGGHGSTINAGLKVAQGKYFKVVDADDWVDTSEFKKLVNLLKDLDIDCICSDYNHIYEHSKKTIKVDMCKGKPYNILNVNELDNFTFAMHSLTFKTETIRNVRLTEHCFYVDVEYNLFSYKNCNTLKYVPLNVYQYRLGRLGQSVSPQGFYKHRNDRLKVCHNIVNTLYSIENKDNKFNVIFNDIINILKFYYTDYITIKGKETDYDAENRAVILTPQKTTSGVKDRWLKKNSHYVRAVKYIYYDTY